MTDLEQAVVDFGMAMYNAGHENTIPPEEAIGPALYRVQALVAELQRELKALQKELDEADAKLDDLGTELFHAFQMAR